MRLGRGLLATVALAAMLGCAAQSTPKREMRGAWVATVYGIDWPSTRGVTAEVADKQRRELSSLIEGLAEAGVNALFFQVRPNADALYSSSLEPWSAHLTGERGARPAYDPLQYCVERCHELGVECHAWINPFRVGAKAPSTPLDARASAMWLTNRVGKSTMVIFNPALPQTRQRLAQVCVELAENYDIDGIIFDDYFYNPEFIPADHTAADWRDYKASGDTISMADWRRRNIDAAIAEAARAIAAVKDGKIRFGVSPQGIAGGNGAHASAGVPALTDYGVTTADSQYDKIFSDPVSWLRDGSIDYISPQIYWTTDNPRHAYGNLARWWDDVALMFGRHCFPSQTLASFNKGNNAEVWAESLAQSRVNRDVNADGAPGGLLYSAACVSGPRHKGFGRVLADSLYTSKALLPPMTWKARGEEQRLNGLRAEGGRLTWDRADDCRYVVYAIPPEVDILDALAPDGDGLDARFIVAVTYTNRMAIPACLSGHLIAVAPYDRYGMEWQPAFISLNH